MTIVNRCRRFAGRPELSEGRITPDEFTERTLIAAEARTIGDLRPVLDDLPVAYGGSPTAAVVAGNDAVEWRGTFGSIKRKGAWTVPSKILIQRRMGSVELDFTGAQFASPVTDIELDVIGGSIEIRVHEGTTVGGRSGRAERSGRRHSATASPRTRLTASPRLTRPGTLPPVQRGRAGGERGSATTGLYCAE